MTNSIPIEWVANTLAQKDGVLKIESVSHQVLRVSRSEYTPFVAGIVSVTRVEVDTVRPLVNSQLGVEIIANVPKESYWTGEALRYAHDNRIATGTFADLLRVIGRQEVRAFRSRKTEFIERALGQHNRISSFEQVFDWVYRISRKSLPDLTVAMLDEYELTSDRLRTARDWYGPFTLAIITNPSGQATRSAYEAAQTMGVEILKWLSFLTRLNTR